MLKDQEYERLGGLVQSSLKTGITTGLFRPNIDVDFVSRLYINGMRGIRDIAIFPQADFNIKTLFESYLEYHARAIVTAKGLAILNNYIATSNKIDENKLLISIFVLVVSNIIAQETPTAFSLDEAVEWGMQYNRTLQRASMELQKAHKEKWKTISIGFPQINANLQYQNNIEQAVSLVPAQFFGGNEGEFAELIFGTQQTAMANIELSQLLFDGTYIVGVQVDKALHKYCRKCTRKNTNRNQKAVITAYVNALVARENNRILKRNAQTIQNNIREVEQLVANGFAEEESLEQLRLTLSSLTTQIQYSQKATTLAENVLKLLLGIDIVEQPQLTDSLDALTARHLLETTPTTDYNNNIDIRLAEDNVVSEQLLYRLERAKGLPSFSAFLNGNYMGNSNDFTFTQRDQKMVWSSSFLDCEFEYLFLARSGAQQDRKRRNSACNKPKHN